MQRSTEAMSLRSFSSAPLDTVRPGVLQLESHAAALTARRAAANILSLVNDIYAVRRPGFPAPAARVANCAFVELLLRGWPCVAVVTTVPVTVGEELLTSHGPHFWHYVADTEARLNLILARLDPGGRAAAANRASAPTVDLLSEIQDEAVATTPPADSSTSRHVLQMNGDAICAVALAAPLDAASSAELPSFPAASMLNITGTTSGGDATATFVPLLESNAWDGRALVVTAAPDASAAQVARLASLAARMNNKGKAAFVADCDGAEHASRSRRLYLLSPGRVADAVLSSLPAVRNLTLPAGALLALVFAPSRKAAAAPAPSGDAVQAAVEPEPIKAVPTATDVQSVTRPEPTATHVPIAPAAQAAAEPEAAPSLAQTATSVQAAAEPDAFADPAPKVPTLPEAPAPAPRKETRRRQGKGVPLTWTCATCDISSTGTYAVCGRCRWLRGPAAAAASGPSMIPSADAAAEGFFAAELVVTLRAASRPLPVHLLSSLARARWRRPLPASAVSRYGSLGAFPRAAQAVQVSDPANGAVFAGTPHRHVRVRQRRG